MTIQIEGAAVAGAESSAAEPLLTVKDMARLLSVPVKRVYELGIPAVRFLTRSLRWRRSDVQQWIERRIKR